MKRVIHSRRKLKREILDRVAAVCRKAEKGEWVESVRDLIGKDPADVG